MLSPFIIANKERIAIGTDANLSLRQNIATPKKVKPKNIGITPKKYFITFGIAFLTVLNIVEYSLM